MSGESPWQTNPNEDIFDRMRKQPEKSWINWILILINVVVFIYAELTGNTNDVEHMLKLGASYAPFVQAGEYYRLFTSMFLHFGISHLANNMILLLFIGDYVERYMGRICYLILYLSSGVFAGWFSYRHDLASGSTSVSAGASGDIFGVIGCLLVLVSIHRGHLENMTLTRVILMAAFSLIVGFQTAGVNGYAHLGGFIGGVALTVVLWPVSKDNRKGNRHPLRNS
ncbi:MAG: rhomboid family intramembrane serine protease [Lachnospiraceae bacterium]|jgi:rhomboid protease GluP|nr:rhomboid family intramembrane serine protease [Lachnospiraceae bacterium]MCI1329030.1 rhomboid family intramembrane serine protease [Lachnospiraceae bacterium]